MNRFSCKCLAALCLLCALALPACAEIDLAPYEIESAYGSTVIPLADGARLVRHDALMNKGKMSSALVLYEHGQKVFEQPLPDEDADGILSFFDVFSTDDGRFGLVRYSGDRRSREYLLLKDGQLTSAFTLSDLNGVRLLDNRICGVREDGSALEVRDWNGRLLRSIDLPFQRPSIWHYAFHDDGSLSFVLIDRHGPDDASLYLCRTTKDGTMRHNLLLEEPYTGTYANQAGFNARGGMLLSDTPFSDNTVENLLCVSGQDEVLWRKTLSAPKAIVGVSLVDLHDDGTATLWGTAVAHSRRLYTVFRMELDAQGGMVALDARDFTTHCAYQYDLVRSPDGEVLVRTQTYGADGGDYDIALVPFDDLPVTKDPGLVIE